MHRLKDRGRVVFLHPLADQGRTLGADVAQFLAAIAPAGDRVLVERILWLKTQFHQITRGAHHGLHPPVALAPALV